MDLLNKVLKESLGVAKKIQKKYDELKQRKVGSEGEKLQPKCCNHQTNSFVKEGEFNQCGGRSGVCGTTKDHRRMYCCKKCYGKYVRK